MTSREARTARREAERKAAKQAAKAAKAAPALGRIGFVSQTDAEVAPAPHQDLDGFVSQSAPEPSNRADINRFNAQRSTGPTTPQGKLASSPFVP